MSNSGLWSLPVGWCWSTFSTVAEIASNLVSPVEWADKPHIAPDNIERDTGRLLAYRTIAEDSMTSPKHLFKPGQILYSKIRPYLNKCVRISFQGLCSADMYPLDARIDAGYLHYYILSQQFVSDVTQAAGSRTVLPKTNQEQLSAVPVPVAPLLEQRRISESLDSYFTRLAEAATLLDRVERNLKRYRASVLKAAVEGRLVPTEAALARQEGRDYEPASVLLERILKERRRRWSESGKKGGYQEPILPDATNLPDLPDGWCWATLDQLTTMVTSGSRGWAEYYSESGPIFIRAQDIKTDSLNLAEAAHVSLPTRIEGTRTLVEMEDILVTITGANVTKTAIVTRELGEAYVSQHVALCRLVQPSLAQYLYIWIVAPTAGRRILEAAAYGAGKPGLNLDNLRGLHIAIPPIAEQARLVREVERLESTSTVVVRTVKAQQGRSARLRQSILKWAFEGKLADQDPDDEPASVLLERIKAERDTPKPAKKKSRS